jgi:hypothetical protein
MINVGYSFSLRISYIFNLPVTLEKELKKSHHNSFKFEFGFRFEGVLCFAKCLAGILKRRRLGTLRRPWMALMQQQRVATDGKALD